MRSRFPTLLGAMLLAAPGAAPAEGPLRPDAPWVRLHLGATPFDARRELYLGRFVTAVSAGYRFSEMGVFGEVEYDATFDFTRETERLSLVNVGLGGEWLFFGGKVRTAVVAGASILAEPTVIDEAGTAGWFVDVRPLAIRWGVGRSWAIELTPLTFDFATPVTKGLPLVLTSYFSLLAGEWSLQ